MLYFGICLNLISFVDEKAPSVMQQIVIRIVRPLVDGLNTNGTKYLLNHVLIRSGLGFVAY